MTTSRASTGAIAETADEAEPVYAPIRLTVYAWLDAESANYRGEPLLVEVLPQAIVLYGQRQPDDNHPPRELIHRLNELSPY